MPTPKPTESVTEVISQPSSPDIQASPEVSPPLDPTELKEWLESQIKAEPKSFSSRGDQVRQSYNQGYQAMAQATLSKYFS